MGEFSATLQHRLREAHASLRAALAAGDARGRPGGRFRAGYGGTLRPDFSRLWVCSGSARRRGFLPENTGSLFGPAYLGREKVNGTIHGTIPPK